MPAVMRGCNCVSLFCVTCRENKLQEYQIFSVQALKFLLRRYCESKINKDLNTLYKDTLESIVISKAFKDAVMRNSPYTYLKTHLKKVENLSDDDATILAKSANEGSKVFEKWETICSNLLSCQMIDRRRLSVDQLYRAQDFAWCLQYQDNIRRKKTKPSEPFYSEEKFESIKSFIKDSGILEDVDHDPKQITALCSRLQRELVKNPR